jgi:hypothetical protein
MGIWFAPHYPRSEENFVRVHWFGMLLTLCSSWGGVATRPESGDPPPPTSTAAAAPLVIKSEDPAKLPEGAFAKFIASARMEKGDKVYWSVYPDPVRRDPPEGGSDGILRLDGVKGVEYRIEARVINLTTGNTRYDEGVVRFTFGGKPAPPPVTPPPVDPVPPAGTKYYFAVVRPDGTPSPEFTKYMANPGWAKLKEMGHQVKAFPLTDAKSKNLDPGSTPLPAVLKLAPTDDGKGSIILGPAVPGPATEAGILKLVEVK